MIDCITTANPTMGFKCHYCITCLNLHNNPTRKETWNVWKQRLRKQSNFLPVMLLVSHQTGESHNYTEYREAFTTFIID